LYKFPLVAAAVFTSELTGPIKLTPIRIATNPPIKFAIIIISIIPPSQSMIGNNYI